MSQPTPLDPKTDVTKEAKLNRLCEKCLKIAQQIMMLQKSCSTNPNNPTIHVMDHHDSSNALIMAAHAGCHLCTLLLQEVGVAMMEDMHILEAKNCLERRQADAKLKSSYQVELSGHLEYGNTSWRHCMYRPISKALKVPTFEWPELERYVSLQVILPSKAEKHEEAENPHGMSYLTELRVKHLFGLFTLRSLFHETRCLSFNLRAADVVLRW